MYNIREIRNIKHEKINTNKDKDFVKLSEEWFDNFLYQRFGNTGDCNVSYLNKSIRDLKRNGFDIVKGEKVTTFIYTVIARKK